MRLIFWIRTLSAFNRNPESTDTAPHQTTSMRSAVNSGVSAIRADAKRAIRTCVNRTLLGHAKTFFPIRNTSRLAMGREWRGSYRAGAHLNSNFGCRKRWGTREMAYAHCASSQRINGGNGYSHGQRRERKALEFGRIQEIAGMRRSGIRVAESLSV